MEILRTSKFTFQLCNTMRQIRNRICRMTSIKFNSFNSYQEVIEIWNILKFQLATREWISKPSLEKDKKIVHITFIYQNSRSLEFMGPSGRRDICHKQRKCKTFTTWWMCFANPASQIFALSSRFRPSVRSSHLTFSPLYDASPDSPFTRITKSTRLSIITTITRFTRITKCIQIYQNLNIHRESQDSPDSPGSQEKTDSAKSVKDLTKNISALQATLA